MKKLLLLLSLAAGTAAFAQTSYRDSLRFHQFNYMKNHEVVKGNDVSYLQFFEIDPAFRVMAKVERKENSPWQSFATSGPLKQNFRVWGIARFTLNNVPVELNIYQSQSLVGNPTYKSYLFLPFIDATTGAETYSGGRYIDLQSTDYKNGEMPIDFNKAYNPYCAYVSGKYSCPIPPKENAVPLAIRAGEKAYGKH